MTSIDRKQPVMIVKNFEGDESVSLSSKSIKSMLGDIPYGILQILSRKGEPLYSKDIRELLTPLIGKALTEQTIYYHLRNLIDRGYLETISDKVVDSNDRLINIQKYRIRSKRFLIDFSEQMNTILSRPQFLDAFEYKNNFIGHLVIGRNSNDNPYIGPISFMIGKYFASIYSNNNLVYFDNQIVENQLLSENLILIGGPFVQPNLYLHQNKFNKQLNELLPVKFSLSNDFSFEVQKEKRRIAELEVGVVQCIKNPWNEKNTIMVVGGQKRIGTEAAAHALLKFPYKVDKILKEHKYCLVKPIVDEKRRLNKIVDFELFH